MRDGKGSTSTEAFRARLQRVILAALCRAFVAVMLAAACILAVAALAVVLLLGDWLYAGWQMQHVTVGLNQTVRRALAPGTDEQQLALFLRRYQPKIALADGMTGVLMVPASPPVETLAGRCELWLYVAVARGSVERPYVVRGCLSP